MAIETFLNRTCEVPNLTDERVDGSKELVTEKTFRPRKSPGGRISEIGDGFGYFPPEFEMFSKPFVGIDKRISVETHLVRHDSRFSMELHKFF